MLYRYLKQLPDKPEDNVSLLLVANPNFIKIDLIIFWLCHLYTWFLPPQGPYCPKAYQIYKCDSNLSK